MRVGGIDLTRLDDKRLTLLRQDRIGFVFQAFNLVPTLTALENITLPAALAGRKPGQGLARQRHPDGRAGRSSGPSAQRAVGWPAAAGGRCPSARRPAEIVFADEPTGNLDSRAGADILSFMGHAARELHQTIVMVTHDPVAASYASRVVFLNDGRIVDEMTEPTAERVLDRMKQFGE